jgi:hyperosmotically inducible protein
MNKRPKNVFISSSLLLSMLLLGGAFVRAVPASTQGKSKAPGTAEISHSQEWLMKEVRHQLVMLPYYTVFDNLAYEVNGSTVTLVGQVVKPTLKSDAGNAVKRIEGVENVVNNIEVLPLSPNDDRIRRNVYRAIYSFPSLQRYQLQAVPPIHIIVKNGNVTLTGVVANEGDKNAANIRANTVSGVFSVTNNLEVEKK